LHYAVRAVRIFIPSVEMEDPDMGSLM